MDNTPKSTRQGFEQALRLLSRREHATRELSQKMRQRGYDQIQIQEVTQRCRELGYLDDGRFAEAYLKDLMRRGYGQHYIRQALCQKGLDESLVDRVMGEMAVVAQEAARAESVLLKKIKPGGPSTDNRHQRARLYGFLYRRGFCADAIRQALDRHLSV